MGKKTLILTAILFFASAAIAAFAGSTRDTSGADLRNGPGRHGPGIRVQHDGGNADSRGPAF